MNELIKVNYDSDRPTVSARELHEFLEIQERFSKWYDRMSEYGFTESIDYTPYQMVHPQNNQILIDYQLTIEMAKEICMLQRNEKGKQARQYFIQLEAAWNTPEMVMSRALKMAERQLDSLRIVNAGLTVKNQIMAPKAEYFDELVDRNLLTNVRETAKELHVGPKAFVAFLIKRKYIYRDKRGKLLPYQQYVDSGLFEVKECFNEKTQWSGTQMLFTPKGRETFRLLYLKTA